MLEVKSHLRSIPQTLEDLEDYRNVAVNTGLANFFCPDVQILMIQNSDLFFNSSASKTVAIARVGDTLRLRKVRERTESLLSPSPRSVDRLGTGSFSRVYSIDRMRCT
jgi:hypothetical protein